MVPLVLNPGIRYRRVDVPALYAQGKAPAEVPKSSLDHQRRLKLLCPTSVRTPDGPTPTLVSTPVALSSPATG